MMKIMASFGGMLMGGLLYIVSRSESLLMFRWFDMLGIQDEVRALRFWTHPYLNSLPHWVYFSLPQALWYFSGLLAFELIWGTDASIFQQRRAWICVFSVLALTLEFGQFFDIVPGRFDLLDLALLLVAWVVAAAISSFRSHLTLNSSLEICRCSGT